MFCTCSPTKNRRTCVMVHVCVVLLYAYTFCHTFMFVLNLHERLTLDVWMVLSGVCAMIHVFRSIKNGRYRWTIDVCVVFVHDEVCLSTLTFVSSTRKHRSFVPCVVFMHAYIFLSTDTLFVNTLFRVILNVCVTYSHFNIRLSTHSSCRKWRIRSFFPSSVWLLLVRACFHTFKLVCISSVRVIVNASVCLLHVYVYN